MIAARARSRWLLGLVPVVLSAFVFRPILSDYFKRDDFLHLYELSNHGFWEFVLTPHGGHLLLASNLAFYACSQLFGMQAGGYQALAFLTHLLNVALVFLVIGRLTRRWVLAAFGASLWGMCPVNLESLFWFSVYGHVLATTFLLALLAGMAAALGDEGSPSRRQQIGWLALALLMSVSFGVGLGVGLGLTFVVLLLFWERPERLRITALFAALAVALPLIYFAQLRLFASISVIAGKYEVLFSRPTDVGLWTTMVASANVALHLLGYGFSALVLGPLIALGQETVAFGPFRGAFPVQLLQASYAVSALAVLGAGLIVLRRGGEGRLRVLAILLIAICAYGMIALGRSWMMSLDWVQLPRMVTTQRYHYLATAILAVALCVALAAAVRSEALRRWGTWGFALWAVVMPLSYALSVEAIYPDTGSKARQEHEEVVASIRSEVMNHPPGSEVYLVNRPFKAVNRILGSLHVPGTAAVFVISFPENRLEGRRVFFVERDRDAVRVAREREGTRIAGLLLTPEEATERQRGGPAGSRRNPPPFGDTMIPR